MKYRGRAVVISETDPVPRSMRVQRDVVVLTKREAAAVARGDAKALVDLHRAIEVYERREFKKTLMGKP